MKTLEELIEQDEGLSLKVYRDTQGVYSIGYGRNLEDIGITEEEADFLLQNDCDRARQEAEGFWWFPALDETRQLVVLSMLYNLGLTRFLGFHKMILAMRNRDFKTAAEEMRNSIWAKQVKERAERLAVMMETGVGPD